MTSTRKFRCEDLFRFNNVNLDVLTETVKEVDGVRVPAPMV